MREEGVVLSFIVSLAGVEMLVVLSSDPTHKMGKGLVIFLGCAESAVHMCHIADTAPPRNCSNVTWPF